MDPNTVLLIGGGGREHALAAKIAESPKCKQLFIAPGNGGTHEYGKNVSLNASDFTALENFVQDHGVDLIVVGPEAPLVEGVTDFIQKTFHGQVKIVGPDAYAAQLEGSKAFAKKFMQKYQIPTAGYLEVNSNNLDAGIQFLRDRRGPYVLKADGLAAGKGVLIIQDVEEAESELRHMLGGKFGKASTTVVIEEFLDGIEFSMFVLTDGLRYTILPQAKDYKRIGEGDTGLNTGGMGAISPVSFLDKEMLDKVEKQIIQPTIQGLHQENMNYRGFVFFGLIKVKQEPFVIEYNCRMGDPETEAVLPRLDEDIIALFQGLFNGSLNNGYCQEKPAFAATIVLVSGGYPEAFEKGKVIHFPTETPSLVEVFHAGTSEMNGQIMTSGGRVLAITGIGDSKENALDKALTMAEKIEFEGKYYRKDIGFDL